MSSDRTAGKNISRRIKLKLLGLCASQFIMTTRTVGLVHFFFRLGQKPCLATGVPEPHCISFFPLEKPLIAGPHQGSASPNPRTTLSREDIYYHTTHTAYTVVPVYVEELMMAVCLPNSSSILMHIHSCWPNTGTVHVILHTSV